MAAVLAVAVAAADGAKGPPGYSPCRHPTPAYSERPLPDECTIAHTRRARRRRLSPSEPGPPPPPCPRTVFEFVRRDDSGSLELALHCTQTARVPNVDHNLPVYGRNALIRGSALLADPAGVLSVAVHVHGSVKLCIADMGTTMSLTTILALSSTLYDGTGGACPTTLPISIALPPLAEDATGKMVALPPSYDAELQTESISKLRAIVAYEITLVVTRKVRRLFTKTKLLVAPFLYRPRTRPSHAPPTCSRAVGSVLAALKTGPERWSHFAATLPLCADESARAISDLVVPKSQVYMLSAPIPFHLQLTLPPAFSLDSVLQPQEAAPPPAAEQSSSFWRTCLPHTRGESCSYPSRNSAGGPPPSAFLPNLVCSSTSNLLASLSRASSLGSRMRASISGLAACAPLPISRLSVCAPPASHARRLSLPVACRGSPTFDMLKGAVEASTLPAISVPQVILLRRVTVTVRGHRAWSTVVCGEGTLRPMHDVARSDGECLAWDGQIVPDEEKLGGLAGFKTDGLQVEDFIVVAWPLAAHAVGPRELLHVVNVKLVTDPFTATS